MGSVADFDTQIAIAFSFYKGGGLPVDFPLNRRVTWNYYYNVTPHPKSTISLDLPVGVYFFNVATSRYAHMVIDTIRAIDNSNKVRRYFSNWENSGTRYQGNLIIIDSPTTLILEYYGYAGFTNSSGSSTFDLLKKS